MFAEKDLSMSSCLVGFFFSFSGTYIISVCVVASPSAPNLFFSSREKTGVDKTSFKSKTDLNYYLQDQRRICVKIGIVEY